MFILKEIKYKNILEIDYLEIPFNQVICIVGESGSGKTTLIRLLNHLISCDSGDIYYKDTDLKDYDPVQLRREVVMLPQVPIIFPGTIKDNLLLGLELSEKPLVSEETLLKMMQTINLNKDLQTDAFELSGGEKQRLALARILLMAPDVLILDEPSSSLDEDTEIFIIEKLVDYTKSNYKTLIMVTHSKKLAQKYGENVISMEKGIIKKDN